MIDPAKPPKQLHVLVTEGSSTSAREAITILGLSGHRVEVCDPSPYCLARFSRFVRKFHRCPGLRTDPAGVKSEPAAAETGPSDGPGGYADTSASADTQQQGEH